MKKFGFIGIVGALLLTLTTMVSAPVSADPPKPARKNVPQYLQDISVTIRAGGGGYGSAEGSGVYKVTKDGQVWVWTCGHLIEHARSTRKGDDGKTFVEFQDVQILKKINEDGRKVGETNFDAEVIRYSHAEYGEDLALLRLRSRKAFKPTQSVEFYLDKEIPAIGTELLHCGSLLGTMGSTSVTNGIVSQQGRVLFNNVIFDQTNCACFPGSSGGIICLKDDGRYVGMLVRGAGETFGLYVPVRRMQVWAKKVGVEFAMNDKLPVPSDDELKKKPVDDSIRATPVNDRAAAQSPHTIEFPTKIKLIKAPQSLLSVDFGIHLDK
jgi:hypothetical protein